MGNSQRSVMLEYFLCIVGNRDVITGCKYGEPNAISKRARCMKT